MLSKLGPYLNPDLFDSIGNTPLIYTTECDDTNAMSILIKNGANVNQKSQIKQLTPLAAAILQHNNRSVAFLLKKNANPNGLVVDSVSPLMLAANSGLYASCSLLIDHGADINYYHPKWGSPLLFSINNSDYKISEMLLNLNANINVVDSNGEPLIILASAGNDTQSVGLLLSHGVAIDMPNIKGNSALKIAALGGLTEMVNFLLKNGSNPSLLGPKENHFSPAMYAILGNQYECAKVLLPLDINFRKPIIRERWIAMARMSKHFEIAELIEQTTK